MGLIRKRRRLLGAGSATGTPPVNSVAPSITGTSPYYVGTTILGTAGVYTGDPTPTVSSQYELDTGSGYIAVPAATALNWIIENKYQYGNLRMAETATNASGSITTYSNVIALFDIRAVGGNLVSWRDSDDDRTVFSTSGLVYQFDDRQNPVYNLTQPDGVFQPLTGVNTVNGRNVLSLNVSLMYGPSFIYALANKSIYFVFKGSPQGIERSYYSERNIATSTAFLVACNNTANFDDTRCFIRSNNNATQNFADASNWLDGARHTQQFFLTNSTYEMKVDGVSTRTGGYSKKANTLTHFGLGGQKAATEQGGIVGDFCEMLVYDAVHGPTEEAAVLGYISAKW